MAGIHVYNITKESHSGFNNFYCGRGSILGNPYTHIKDKQTKALYIVKTRDDAISQYDHYFDLMYSSNTEYKKKIDEIYDLYKTGVDVYLGCYCSPLPCHCDIIKNKIEQKLIKEKIKLLRK